MEIGKFDLSSDNPLGVELFARGASFHGVMLDRMLLTQPVVKVTLHKLLLEGVKQGAVKPLVRTVFKHNEVEQAFRYMAAGKHVGKVLVKVREEEDEVTGHMKGIPRYVYVNMLISARFHLFGILTNIAMLKYDKYF